MFGATQKEWETFSNLCLRDIRPTVNNQGLGDYSKTPSQLVNGQPFRMSGWPTFITTADDVKKWMIELDHGFGIVCRKFKGIDIDVKHNEALAEQIESFFNGWFDKNPPLRMRAGSSSRLMLFKISDDPHNRNKIVVSLPKDAQGNDQSVEFRFDREFVACCGQHKSGARQVWVDIDEGVPEITNSRLDEMINAFTKEFAGRATEGRAGIEVDTRSYDQIDTDDALYKYVINSSYFLGHKSDGSVVVKCPYCSSHTTPTKYGDTVFFPKGLGGRDIAGVKCMHSNHGGLGELTMQMFTTGIGFSDGFEKVAQLPQLNVVRNKNGECQCTLTNCLACIEYLHALGELSLYKETFSQNNYIKLPTDEEHRRLCKDDRTEISMRFEALQMRPVTESIVDRAIDYYLNKHQVNDVRDWLAPLEWDGVSRIKNFCKDILNAKTISGTTDEYLEAVSLYTWTALYGRAIKPGVKADMTLVLYGRQGTGKTSICKAMSPKPEWYGSIDFSTKPDDIVRLIKGKLIVELEEMAGVDGKNHSALKRYLSSQVDEIVPKYSNDVIDMKRSAFNICTTNVKTFLTDSTGSRRFLPITCGKIDVQYVIDNCKQYWAEARELYGRYGIMWAKAEKLSKNVHWFYQPKPSNFNSLCRILEDKNEVYYDDIVRFLQANRNDYRGDIQLRGALEYMNWTEVDDGLWKKELSEEDVFNMFF